VPGSLYRLVHFLPYAHATERIFHFDLNAKTSANSARADAEDIPLIKDHFGGSC
jgi:hypothetical protein